MPVIPVGDRRHRSAGAAMSTYVALLRAVNVGGRGKVAMADLRGWCDDIGFKDAVTYIQSGNVVFSAPVTDEERLSVALADRIEAGCGVRTSVIVRPASEMAELAGSNPFLVPGAEPRRLHVAFLADAPAAERVAALDPDRSPPDSFVVSGRHVYLSYPNGSGRSKLTNEYLERTLSTVATARNWNTVTRLVELAERSGSGLATGAVGD